MHPEYTSSSGDSGVSCHSLSLALDPKDAEEEMITIGSSALVEAKKAVTVSATCICAVVVMSITVEFLAWLLNALRSGSFKTESPRHFDP